MNRMKREGLATCTLLVLFCRGSGVLSSEDAGRKFPQKGSAGRGNLTHRETETSSDMEHFAGSFNMPMGSNDSGGPCNLSNEATVLLEESANEDNGKKPDVDALDAQMDALDKKIREIHDLANIEPSQWAEGLINRRIPRRIAELIAELTQEQAQEREELKEREQLKELKALKFQLQTESQGVQAMMILSSESQRERLSEYQARLEELKEHLKELKELKEHLKIPLGTHMRLETHMRQAALLLDDAPHRERQILQQGQIQLQGLLRQGLALQGLSQQEIEQRLSQFFACSLPKSFGGRKGIAKLMQIVAPLAMSIILITVFLELILAERKRRASKQRIARKA